MKSTFHIISPAPSNFFRPYLALYLQAMNKFASGGQINTYDQSGFVTVDPSSQFCYLILKRFFYAAYTYMTPPPPSIRYIEAPLVIHVGPPKTRKAV